MPSDPDHALRVAANRRARDLQQQYDDIVPLEELRKGFQFEGTRHSFGSFYSGIYRAKAQVGPAALTLNTAPPKAGKPPPYADEIFAEERAILYHFRAGPLDQPDNRALLAARDLEVPLIYFAGIATKQYMVAQPVFITDVDLAARVVADGGGPSAARRSRGRAALERGHA